MNKLCIYCGWPGDLLTWCPAMPKGQAPQWVTLATQTSTTTNSHIHTTTSLHGHVSSSPCMYWLILVPTTALLSLVWWNKHVPHCGPQIPQDNQCPWQPALGHTDLSYSSHHNILNCSSFPLLSHQFYLITPGSDYIIPTLTGNQPPGKLEHLLPFLLSPVRCTYQVNYPLPPPHHLICPQCPRLPDLARVVSCSIDLISMP